MNTNFVYAPKKETCPLCKGSKTVKSTRIVFSFGDKEPSQETKDLAEAMADDDTCPACCGAGEISKPPYETGEETLMQDSKVSELASAGTLLRCIDEPMFVQAVANEAARITLPDDMANTFAAYWADPSRDVNLGEYIRQIAETAEKFAMATYGDLGNRLYAGPRPHKEVDQMSEIEVTAEEMADIQKKIDRINAIPITEVVVTRGGKVLGVAEEERNDMKYAGLTTFTLVKDILSTDNNQ